MKVVDMFIKAVLCLVFAVSAIGGVLFYIGLLIAAIWGITVLVEVLG